MKTEKRYLVPGDYMADPAVHVFDGKLYIYPSHDWESGIAENDNGDHFNMKDYHVYSMDDVMNNALPPVRKPLYSKPEVVSLPNLRLLLPDKISGLYLRSQMRKEAG